MSTQSTAEKGGTKPPRVRRTVVLLTLLYAALLTIVLRTAIVKEQFARQRAVVLRGTDAVNLLAAYPVEYIQHGQRNAFLKMVSDSLTSDGLLYLFVHDGEGRIAVSFGAPSVAAAIPSAVRDQSLQAISVTHAPFRLGPGGQEVHEFARALYQDGERAGTLRLGLAVRRVPWFSLDRLSLLATLTFLTVATIISVHYVLGLALRRFRHLGFEAAGPAAGSGTAVPGGGLILPALEHIDRSMAELRARLEEIHANNLDLISRIAVLTFEKNQAMRILDTLNFGILVLEQERRLVHANQYMTGLLGRHYRDIVDRHIEEVLPAGELLNFTLGDDAHGQTSGIETADVELPSLAPGAVFEAVSFSLAAERGQGAGKVLALRNVTERKMRDRARQAFIADVTHELRTPLTALKGYSEMLIRGNVVNPEMQKQFHNVIHSETNRLIRLVDDLLNISRMDMGGLTARKNVVRSDLLVQDSLPAIEAAAQEKSITVEKRMPDNFPSLVGDKDLLKVALVNILGNAVKYTPEKGRVVFTVADLGQVLSFDVADTGCGIPPEDLPRIFDRFYRSRDPRVAAQTGTGLGLAITAEIVRLHGGEIKVESKVGEGSRFTVLLPKGEYFVGNRPDVESNR